MGSKTDVWQGTLALMVLKTLETMGPLHGYGVARRIEQTSDQRLSVNYGTIYPALLKLEQEGYIASEWGVSDNNRKAKFYRLTRAGRKQSRRRRRPGTRRRRSWPASSNRGRASDDRDAAVQRSRTDALSPSPTARRAVSLALFQAGRHERELADELNSHLQLHIDDNLRAGMTPREARRQAVLALGGVDQTKERLPRRAWHPSVEQFVQDLRFAIRDLACDSRVRHASPS